MRNQEAFCDSKAARLGRLPAGESKPWRCGRGWGVSGGVRDGPEEQSLHGLEPDGVGILPSAARAARRDTEGNGRHAPPRHSDRGRPRGADGRDDGPGAGGGTTLPPRLLWLPPRPIRAGCGRDGTEARFDLAVTIPRDRLRPQYGDGFLGAPLLLCRPSKMQWPDHGGADATAQDKSPNPQGPGEP